MFRHRKMLIWLNQPFTGCYKIVWFRCCSRPLSLNVWYMYCICTVLAQLEICTLSLEWTPTNKSPLIAAPWGSLKASQYIANGKWLGWGGGGEGKISFSVIEALFIWETEHALEFRAKVLKVQCVRARVCVFFHSINQKVKLTHWTFTPSHNPFTSSVSCA